MAGKGAGLCMVWGAWGQELPEGHGSGWACSRQRPGTARLPSSQGIVALTLQQLEELPTF